MTALDLFPLPTTLGDAPKVFLSFLSDEPESGYEALHAGLHLLGYGLGVVHPHDVIPGSAGHVHAAHELSKDELKAHLAALSAPDDGRVRGAIPWESIIMTVLPIILDLWRKRQAK